MSAILPAEPRKSSFAPFVAPDTRLLVLGTLPGEESLRAQRYYAHPRNLFWRLIGTAIERDIESLEYEARVTALREAKVGLWDTIAWAVSTWYDRPAHVAAMKRRAMLIDNSWDHAGKAYEALYREAVAAGRGAGR